MVRGYGLGYCYGYGFCQELWLGVMVMFRVMDMANCYGYGNGYCQGYGQGYGYD